MKMKKLMALVLAGMMTVSTAVPVIAAEDKNEYSVFAILNGEYDLADNLTMQTTLEEAGLKFDFTSVMGADLAEKRNDPSTVEGKMFLGLQKLEQIRKEEKAFVSYADTWTVETWEKGVLCIGRFYDGEKIYGLFNFSEYDKTAWINENDGLYVDLISGQKMKACGVNIPAFGYYYLKKL